MQEIRYRQHISTEDIPKFIEKVSKSIKKGSLKGQHCLVEERRNLKGETLNVTISLFFKENKAKVISKIINGED